MNHAIAWFLVGSAMWLGVPLPSPAQPGDSRLMFAGDAGPHGGGTNPYVVAIVHVRGDGDVTRRIEDLQRRYGFSWDHALSRGSDGIAIRIALHRSDIPSLAREEGVTRVEPLSGSPF